MVLVSQYKSARRGQSSGIFDTSSWEKKVLSIGRYPIVSLAEARTKRDDAKRLLADGQNPSIQKKLDAFDAHVKARMTFREVAEEYYETLVDRGLADAMLRKKRWHIDDVAKPLHSRPIDQVNCGATSSFETHRTLRTPRGSQEASGDNFSGLPLGDGDDARAS